MLQWYANVPEDTAYWVKRFDTGFKATIFLTLIINFLLPLLVLMKRGSKRNFKTVSFAAAMVIIGHHIDFCNMVMYEPNAPAVHGEHHAEVSAVPRALYAENQATDHEHSTPVSDAAHKKETSQPSHATHGAGHSAAAEAHAEHGHSTAAVRSYAGFGLVEILIFIGFAGAFLFMFFSELAKHPLVNENDPYYLESVKHNI
jgi:hypothetical protein